MRSKLAMAAVAPVLATTFIHGPAAARETHAASDSRQHTLKACKHLGTRPPHHASLRYKRPRDRQDAHVRVHLKLDAMRHCRQEGIRSFYVSRIRVMTDHIKANGQRKWATSLHHSVKLSATNHAVNKVRVLRTTRRSTCDRPNSSVGPLPTAKAILVEDFTTGPQNGRSGSQIWHRTLRVKIHGDLC
jgi:hypothetical protein